MGLLGRILPRHRSAPGARRRRTRALYAPFQKSLPRGDGFTLPAAVAARQGRIQIPGLILAAASLAGLAYLLTGARFDAAETAVTGMEFLSPAEITRAGGALGQNVFLLDPAKIAAAISRFPDVESARVRILLPDKVAIRAWEKEPWAALRIGEETYPLARDGTVLTPRDAADFQVILLAEEGTEVRVGDSLPPAILTAAREYQERWDWVEGLGYDPEAGLQLTTPEGHTILLGGPEGIAYKVALVEALRRELPVGSGPSLTADLRFLRPYLSWSGQEAG